MQNLTTGNIYKLMIHFAVPMFISQLFQQLYNTADSIIVGHYLGTAALAAVSSSGTLIFLFISFFEGVSMGAGVIISRHFGAGDKDKTFKAIHSTLALGVLSGLFLTAAGTVLTPTLLTWMKLDPLVMPDAVGYFRCYFAGTITLVMYNISRGIMTAMGDSKRPLYYLILSSCLNVALDTFFIAVLGGTAWTAALATVISQAISALLCLIRLCSGRDGYKVKIKEIKIYKKETLQIIRQGVPSGVQNTVIGFANTIVLSQINSFGMVATAAFGAHAKIEGFAFMPIQSFNMATTTFVSQNIGAGKMDRVRKGAAFGITAAVICDELIGFATLSQIGNIAAIFDSSPEVIALVSRQAHIIMPFYFLLAFDHSVASVCRGAGKAFIPMLIMLSIWCVLRISYIIAVMHLIGDITYIYWAYPLTWAISSLIFGGYYLHFRKVFR